MSVADLRQNYEKNVLLESTAHPLPLDQFATWFAEAVAAAAPEPNAMTLATVDARGQPSARIVLLKGFDERGFVFFTNYCSRKGRDLAGNDRAALLFFWQSLERQVRIEGRVERVESALSDSYFASRPLGSRLGAWASPQSQPTTRAALAASAAEFADRYGDTPPRPADWGGYRLAPELFEFWQGRPSRLHDRLQYLPEADGWRIQRLAP
jgi:pyridoxamine 5'-phosphate oxidase